MKNTKEKQALSLYHHNTIQRLIFLFGFLLIVCCSSNSKTKNDDNTDDDIPAIALDSVIFTVIGDVPYDDAERTGLIELIETHNTKANSEFVVHVGDIKPGALPCEESVYEDVSTILKDFETPTFIVLGDNEYNDCEDPVQGFALWNQYFLHLNENWTFPYTVAYQEERLENFAWVAKKVLFIGVNIVGSSVHDAEEWEKRLTDDANWVKDQVDAHKNDIEALVVFGHANMIEAGSAKFRTFTDSFRATATDFNKPILYVQGDGHIWFQNRPYDERNILRVQVDSGPKAVKVTVNPNLEQPFVFDREFLD
ncbi:metallophosphoesterase [uncultured Kriegella sp.]|uniref:metallophosphoesterase n=1 Tax=uncultured Kriegella sp. TaxID=1798910 RepID=UPI0030D94C1E|tara:strand:- start:4349 stop:5278 length:930 start_codon:yes stop_codon:yes gene_type:complete